MFVSQAIQNATHAVPRFRGAHVSQSGAPKGDPLQVPMLQQNTFRKLLSTFIPCFCQEVFYWTSETKLATVVFQLSQLSLAVACRLKQTS